jgi:hypothetical protein
VTDVVSNPSLIVFRCVFSGASEEIPLGEDKQPTPSPVLIITPPPPFAVIKYHAYGCFKMLAALIFGIDLRTSDLEGARDRDDDPIDFDRLTAIDNGAANRESGNGTTMNLNPLLFIISQQVAVPVLPARGVRNATLEVVALVVPSQFDPKAWLGTVCARSCRTARRRRAAVDSLQTHLRVGRVLV